MNNALHFLTFLEKTFKTIWKDEKIQSRTKGMCVVIPLVLTALLIGIHQLFYRNIALVPYVFLFSIILISASYGGSRSALFATLITFAGAVFYHFLGMPHDYITLCLYLVSGLFITALLHFFAQQQRVRDELLFETNQRNEELVRLEKNHEDFVNMASHELKLPVTVLKAYIQMIFLKKDKPGFVESYLTITEKMEIQLDKLLNIIADLQDATKVKGGSLTCLMNTFNLNESIRNSIDGLLVANNDVVVEYDLVYPDPVVKGDKDRIEQVLSNFIGNALKYAGQEKYISLSCSLQKDEWVKVVVKDRGYGIPAEKQPYLFERFYRVETPQVKKLPGLGLGLFICKEIIKQHDGRIGVTSEEGKGSEFWFCLPLKS